MSHPGVILTFMSTQAYIASLEATGKLWRYLPRGRHPPVRRLYLTESAVKDLGPTSAVTLLSLRGFVESAFTRWTSGGLVYADSRSRPRFLKRLDPPPQEIWEIRITDPDIQVRALCRFPEPDTLITTRIATRDLFGRRDSRTREWQQAMNDCETVWSDLGLPIHTGVVIKDYVTRNCDDFPI
jgi:hypothetical protein